MKNYRVNIALFIAGIALIVGLIGMGKTPQISNDEKNQIVSEIKTEIPIVGSSGSIYTSMITLLDGLLFETRGRSGGALRGDGMAFANGTTTVCTIQSPKNATTTWVGFNIAVTNNATTTAREVSIATSTVPNATTSPVLDGSLMTIAGGTKWQMGVNGSTTPGSGTNASRFNILAPGTWINVSLKGGNPGVGTTTELAGYCSLSLQAEGL